MTQTDEDATIHAINIAFENNVIVSPITGTGSSGEVIALAQLLAAATGDWSTALRFNPLIGFGGIGLFIYFPWSAGTVVGDWPRPRLSPAATVKLAWFGVGLGLVNWAYLIVAHY